MSLLINVDPVISVIVGITNIIKWVPSISSFSSTIEKMKKKLPQIPIVKPQYEFTELPTVFCIANTVYKSKSFAFWRDVMKRIEVYLKTTLCFKDSGLK